MIVSGACIVALRCVCMQPVVVILWASDLIGGLYLLSRYQDREHLSSQGVRCSFNFPLQRADRDLRRDSRSTKGKEKKAKQILYPDRELLLKFRCRSIEHEKLEEIYNILYHHAYCPCKYSSKSSAAQQASKKACRRLPHPWKSCSRSMSPQATSFSHSSTAPAPSHLDPTSLLQPQIPKVLREFTVSIAQNVNQHSIEVFWGREGSCHSWRYICNIVAIFGCCRSQAPGA